MEMALEGGAEQTPARVMYLNWNPQGSPPKMVLLAVTLHEGRPRQRPCATERATSALQSVASLEHGPTEGDIVQGQMDGSVLPKVA